MAKAFKLPDRNWTVRNAYVFVVVQAPDQEAAIDKVLETLGYPPGKRYLADGLSVRPATDEDLRRYAALAEAHRPSQPTARSTKHKTVHKRLGLFDG